MSTLGVLSFIMVILIILLMTLRSLYVDHFRRTVKPGRRAKFYLNDETIRGTVKRTSEHFVDIIYSDYRGALKTSTLRRTQIYPSWKQ